MNGEIYNHEELRKSLPNHKFKTGSDCDVIAHLVSCFHLQIYELKLNNVQGLKRVNKQLIFIEQEFMIFE